MIRGRHVCPLLQQSTSSRVPKFKSRVIQNGDHSGVVLRVKDGCRALLMAGSPAHKDARNIRRPTDDSYNMYYHLHFCHGCSVVMRGSGLPQNSSSLETKIFICGYEIRERHSGEHSALPWSTEKCSAACLCGCFLPCFQTRVQRH
jgi:hypothetical protein